jgi:transposase
MPHNRALQAKANPRRGVSTLQGAVPAEYGERLVELFRKGRSAEDLARHFEPSAQAVFNWVRQADRVRGLSGSPRSSELCPSADYPRRRGQGSRDGCDLAAAAAIRRQDACWRAWVVIRRSRSSRGARRTFGRGTRDFAALESRHTGPDTARGRRRCGAGQGVPGSSPKERNSAGTIGHSPQARGRAWRVWPSRTAWPKATISSHA